MWKMTNRNVENVTGKAVLHEMVVVKITAKRYFHCSKDTSCVVNYYLSSICSNTIKIRSHRLTQTNNDDGGPSLPGGGPSLPSHCCCHIYQMTTWNDSPETE